MCGIFGGTVEPEEIKKCLRYIKRGNDGEDIKSWEKHGISFGFKRHAIIAPNDRNSMQPVESFDKKSAIVMNGEIFDYRTLKKEVLRTGLKFQSEGDAEVLLNLYRAKGDRFCDNLDSMYAAAIFDESRDYPRLLIFRDWVGEEPLHYIYNKEERRFVFSSEFKGFLGLSNYNLEEIQALEPGTIVEINLDDFSLRQWKFFSLGIKPEKYSYENIEEIGLELRRLLEQSAEERIISDVPVCCLLSGGLDSTVTTYLINEIMKKRGQELTLYSFHIAEEPIVEGVDLYHARIVAKELGLDKNLIEVHVPRKSVINTMPEIVYAMEDKRSKDFNIYNAICNFFLAKQIAKDGFKVVFNGEGADELHGSYGSWGSFQITPEEITQPEFRLKLVENLHKGVLMRTAKVMMYAGPSEMRTFFLSRRVAEYTVNIPPNFLRKGDVWKVPLVQAFSDVIPANLLKRPKARPTDSTGIMAIKPLLLKKYQNLGSSDQEIFEHFFAESFDPVSVSIAYA